LSQALQVGNSQHSTKDNAKKGAWLPFVLQKQYSCKKINYIDKCYKNCAGTVTYFSIDAAEEKNKIQSKNA
jgi:hypothetical protein